MEHINKENLANFFKENRTKAYALKAFAQEINSKAAIDIEAKFNNDGKLVIKGHSSGSRLLTVIAMGEMLLSIAEDAGKSASEFIVDVLAINADIFNKFDSTRQNR